MEYDELTEQEKTTFKQRFNIERITRYYLEDNNIILLNKKDMINYLILDELEKKRDMEEHISMIHELEIRPEDVGKTVGEILLEQNEKVTKLSKNAFAYKNS